jgi:HPt (histidine-containing phosphotransfer) domain-containing protein
MSDTERVRQQLDRFAAALPRWSETIKQAVRRRDAAALRRALHAVARTARDARLEAIEQRVRELDDRLLDAADFDAANAAVEELLALSWRAVSAA